MPSKTLDIATDSPLHKRILDAVRDRVTASKQAYQSKYDKWRKAEEATLAYVPERSVDALRRAQRNSGAPQYTTIQIPYSYSMLMASHTYWTTVFMSRTPVMQFSGRHGETEMNIQALEAIMDYQVQVGEAIVPWYTWLYDVGKYGIGVVGLYWDTQFASVSAIEEREDLFLGIIPTGKMKKVKTTRRIPGYAGNMLYNLRPFDFFPDPRVSIGRFQTGEFVAVYRKLGYNTLVKRKEQGYYVNIERVKPSKEPTDSSRIEGSSVLELPKADTFFFLNSGDPKKNLDSATVPLYECYIELIPSDWGLGNSSYPEKWVFTTDAWFQTVLGATPLGANHDKFPFGVITLEPEGYSLVPRGMPEILEPVQNTVDWLVNSHFYNVRKILNGQYVVDPSVIAITDMLDPVPGGIIRAKEAGYGKDLRTAIHQLQTVDVTQGHLKDIQIMQNIGERSVGVNDQIMGAMNAGGRRTATEVRSANTFGISRLKTNAELFSAQGWSPVSAMMVQNTQQYYDQEQQFKIAGDLMLNTNERFTKVNPENITGFYDYVPVDGTLPIDRFAQANLWKEMFLGLKQMPEIGLQYDLGRMFAWIAQLAGMKNINQFKLQPQMQVLPDEQLALEADRGNVVPMPGAVDPAMAMQNMARTSEPTQMAGMGAA